MKDHQPNAFVRARLTKWSSVAGLSLKQSGLLKLKGLNVSQVLSAANGYIKSEVTEEYVPNVGDVLFLEPNVSSADLLNFCNDNGLEILTLHASDTSTALSSISSTSLSLPVTLSKGCTNTYFDTTDPELSIRTIRKMIDWLNGKSPSQAEKEDVWLAVDHDPPQILVSYDNAAKHNDMVIIGINSPDRPGLLNKISKCLAEMQLQCHRTEAAVIGVRSFSVWRCERLERHRNDLNEIQASLNKNLVYMKNPRSSSPVSASSFFSQASVDRTWNRGTASIKTASDEEKEIFCSQNVPPSVDGIPLVRYPRYDLEFKVLSSLGKGGFGTVFRCQNVLDCREYAVKRIRIQSFVDEWGVSTTHLSNTLRRVLREVKILALLDHPNIVRYYTSWLEIDDGFGSIEEESTNDACNTLFTDHLKTKIVPQYSRVSNPDVIKYKEQNIDSSYARNLMHMGSVDANDDIGFTWDKIEEIPDAAYQIEQCQHPIVSTALLAQHYTLYIQMQLCSQRTLSDFITSTEKRKRGSLTFIRNDCNSKPRNAEVADLPHALQVFSQIISGVKHVHAQGLIHRDLKPSNCFVDEFGTVKIGDFGLSRGIVKIGVDDANDDTAGLHKKSANELAEGITAGVGTRSYASPEQINGSDYDASTDVYSLGIILFELCYPMNTSMERHLVFSGLRQRIFPREWITTIASIMPNLHDLVYAMLSPTPSERPTSTAVSSQIRRILGEFVFSLGSVWEVKGEQPLLLRVEAIDAEGILNRTVSQIKLAVPGADIMQYGLKGESDKVIMEFAIALRGKDGIGSIDHGTSSRLEIFRTLSTSREIKLIREVSTSL